MKFTLEHAIILILAIAVIYYVIQHSNLVKDVFRIPERDHPELKEPFIGTVAGWLAYEGIEHPDEGAGLFVNIMNPFY